MVTLSEAASKKYLGEFGLPFLTERIVQDPNEAITAAEAIGYPVVIKLCATSLAHKTERGLVRLNVSTGEAVRTAATELLGRATPADGEVALLVAPMVRGTREFIAGVVDDPSFGMSVMLGIGGVLTESLGDVTFRLVPLSRHDATQMISDLATQNLLGPVRGEPPVNRERLAEVLMALSAAAASDPTLRSVDINPLIVVDGEPVAVDALVEVAG
jgi:succinyl-CoA synthetase beta subunit